MSPFSRRLCRRSGSSEFRRRLFTPVRFRQLGTQRSARSRRLPAAESLSFRSAVIPRTSTRLRSYSTSLHKNHLFLTSPLLLLLLFIPLFVIVQFHCFIIYCFLVYGKLKQTVGYSTCTSSVQHGISVVIQFGLCSYLVTFSSVRTPDSETELRRSARTPPPPNG